MSTSVSRRSILLSGLATVCAGHFLLPSAGLVHAAESVEQGVDEYSRLEAAGKLNTTKALENIRSKHNFKRSVDGRVYVKGAKGNYYAVRLDMEVPGAMLFRESETGQVYALQTETLQQIDLSSDQVVILLLADGEWEAEMSPITFEDDSGNVKTLTMSEGQFRNVVGLITIAQEGAEDKQ